jgi:aspartyl-tRNA(Asn)/glutamyl-tRNA(Gln) amidotransferase subunit A
VTSVPVEVTQAVLAHIERWEPHIRATYLLRPEARAGAGARVRGPLAAGRALGRSTACRHHQGQHRHRRATPCRWAPAASRWCPAAADAPPAARLREAGAVMVAKTTMPDYGMLSSGLSSFHPLARNPWDRARTPGGSSAGAGAAAAAGYGPLHIGTDIGGSIRLPASWCGIFGLKPSLGRMPIDPPYTGRAAGPMTRTVADAALMMQVLSQPDARDSMSLPYAGHRLVLGRADRGCRCAACASACCWTPAAACRSNPKCAPPWSTPRRCSSRPAPS